MNTGICPKCEANVGDFSLSFEPVMAKQNTATIKAIQFLCPKCKTVLGVQVDPFALKTELINEVVEELSDRRRR